MPAPKLAAYVRMLPRLQAQGSIRLVNDLLLGTGNMSKQHAEQFLYRLQAIAAGATEDEVESSRVYRPRSAQELASLAGSTTTIVMQ